MKYSSCKTNEAKDDIDICEPCFQILLDHFQKRVDQLLEQEDKK
jgi:hypothetical protein